MHVPALLEEVIGFIDPRDGGTYMDGTLGFGGYSKALLDKSSPTGTVYSFDLDRSAIERTSLRLIEYGARFRPVHAGFHEARASLEELGVTLLDGITLDLGLSTNQLEDPERGFSFRFDGPLDMRFDRESGKTLLELLRTMKAPEIDRIIREYGEERFSSRIARSIVEAMRKGTLNSATELADLVAKAIPGRRGKIHPATRTFQALRIAVNRELDNLETALASLPHMLNVGARLCIVSYHSLEDRLVKVAFRTLAKEGPKWRVVTPKPIRPTNEEARANPRARSARLRVLEAIAPSEF